VNRGAAHRICVAALQDGALDRFLDLGLPSQLAPGNLPALVAAGSVGYTIYVRSEEKSKIGQAAAFAALRRILEPTVVDLSSSQIEPGMADVVEIACEGASIRSAAGADATLIFLGAGTVLADGTLARAAAKIEEGMRAVLTPRLIVDASAARSWTENARTEGRLALAPRRLIAESWPILHPRSRAQFWRTSTIDPMPDQLLFEVGSGAAIALSIRPHVLACKPEKRSIVAEAESAADLVERACPDLRRVATIGDSDDLALVDAWRPEDGHVAAMFPRNAFGVVPWIEHVLLPRVDARPALTVLRDGDVDAERLAGARNEAERVVDEIVGGLGAPDWHLFGCDQRRLGMRLARRHRVVPAHFRARAYHPALRGLITPMAELVGKFPPNMSPLARETAAFLARKPSAMSAKTMNADAPEYEALWRRLREVDA
jgi:hypothetical protein